MNILFLDQFSEMGGAQHCLLDLLPAIREQGWSAHAAIPGTGPFAEKLRAAGVPVERIPCGPYRSGSKNVSDLLRFATDWKRQRSILAGLMGRTNYDLLYVNGPRLLPAAALIAGERVPLLFHAHNPLAGGALRLASWSLRHSAATVIACSESVAGPLLRTGVLRTGALRTRGSGMVHVIPNGTADHGYRPHRTHADPTWRIGVIGRIAPEKGQAEFLQAAGLLAAQCSNVHFVVCGESDPAGQSYGNRVRALAAGLPVEFLGWRDDAIAVLKELDLLVIPSKSEGLPRVLLEAFSAGVPVVAFPAGGIAEAVQNDVTGFLVPERTPAALAARLRELIAGDPDRLRSAGANGRQQWLRTYTVSSYRCRIVNVIQSLVFSRQAEPDTAPPPLRR